MTQENILQITSVHSCITGINNISKNKKSGRNIKKAPTDDYTYDMS